MGFLSQSVRVSSILKQNKSDNCFHCQADDNSNNNKFAIWARVSSIGRMDRFPVNLSNFIITFRFMASQRESAARD